MKLKLKNIGKLKEADIKIDGITIIAGKNNTGKSTVGKSLYCIFSSLYDVNKKIEEDRRNYIRREIERVFINNSLGVRSMFFHIYDEIIENIINNAIEENFEAAKEQILFILQELSKKNKESNIKRKINIPNDEFLNNIFCNIRDALAIPNEDFYKHRLENIFAEEFKNQINNINNNASGLIELTIKKTKMNVNVKGVALNTNLYMDLESDIVYVDDPFVLDNMDYVFSDDILGHRDNIMLKLQDSAKDANMTADIILQDKIKSIMDKLDDIGVGKLVQDEEIYSDSFQYQSQYDKKPIEVTNISAGLKTFIILKTLILNGHIKEKGCIVLDEPEIHLHPEWQLVFAELIVLLQKTFNLHILLNTHSPYFLRAIQIYSAKYEIADRCNYYLAENDLENNMAVIRNVNNDTNVIYKLLYSPFQQLEDEIYYDN